MIIREGKSRIKLFTGNSKGSITSNSVPFLLFKVKQARRKLCHSYANSGLADLGRKWSTVGLPSGREIH